MWIFIRIEAPINNPRVKCRALRTKSFYSDRFIAPSVGTVHEMGSEGTDRCLVCVNGAKLVGFDRFVSPSPLLSPFPDCVRESGFATH